MSGHYRNLAVEVADAFRADIAIGSAPGITLDDLIEVNLTDCAADCGQCLRCVQRRAMQAASAAMVARNHLKRQCSTCAPDGVDLCCATCPVRDALAALERP